jgi:lysophospholipase L1-like esterase
MRIEPHSKLLLIGDSITDAERWRPFVEGPLAALGNGYVQLVAGMLGARCPERRIRVINMGVSGNTVRDLKARWQSDVQKQRPDWLSIMIGINDVWRHFDSPHLPALHVSLDEYAATLDELLRVLYRAEPRRADARADGPLRRGCAAARGRSRRDLCGHAGRLRRGAASSASVGDRRRPGASE